MKPAELTPVSVSDLLSETRSFSLTDRVSTLIGYLKETRSYEAFVQNDEGTSIVTLRDLLDVQDLEQKLYLLAHRVPRLNSSNTVGDAATLMFEYRARSMPVYRGKAFLGKITAESIVSKLLESKMAVKISSIMTPDPITLGPAAVVAQAREIMIRKRIDQVPVVEGQRLVNITTSADVVFNLSPATDRDEAGNPRAKRNEDPVAVFGKSELVTNAPNDSISTVYENIRTKSSNYSIIADSSGVKGIVTYRDFMKLLITKDAIPVPPMYIIGLPEDLYQASLVRSKFTETAKLLKHVLPDVIELRAVIEAEGNNPAKKKNLVKVLVISPKKNYSYKVFSFDLGEAFDQIHSWAKRLVESEKPSVKPGRRNTIERRGQRPDFPEEA